MKKSALFWAAVVLAVTSGVVTAQTAPNVFESSGPLPPATALDRFVLPKHVTMGYRPVLCSDAVFVRRVYLDVIGTLPTAKEAREFIEDKRLNKRRLLIDKLLERDEFADYWAMKWGDILRIKAEFPVNLWPNAAQAYHHWVRASIAENKPYDKFVRELLTSSGSNFRVGPVNFYRAVQNRTPEGIATAVALTFMGTRAEFWPKEYLPGMAVFFSQIGYKPTREWKEEVVFWDPLQSGAKKEEKDAKDAKDKPKPGQTVIVATQPTTAPVALKAMYPDGTSVTVPPNKDPREFFADWLITPTHPWFSKNITNRVWSWLLGRGIIHEPDDIRRDNPPSNPELLAFLEKEFVTSKYDLKHLYRLILNSHTYQLTSMPRSKNPQGETMFVSYPLRRLEAEVLIDAINKITGSTDLYTSAIPEPFTYIPKDQPAIAIADGSITSPFLSLFGRSARATGMENERSNRPLPSQWLHLLNSSHIQRKLDQGSKMKEMFDPKRKQEEIVTDLYLTILSRFPTPEEMKNALEFGQSVTTGRGPNRTTGKRREDWVDIAWALINSSEFLYRH